MSEPASPASFEQALEFYQGGANHAAEEICRRLLEENPENHDAVYLLGLISLRWDRRLSMRTDALSEYHIWHYFRAFEKGPNWMGVRIVKSLPDLWNYQEILFELKPSLVIEFGMMHGGSALYFSSILRLMGNPYRVITIDIDHTFLNDAVKADPNIETMQASSTSLEVRQRLEELIAEFPGPIFAILDSDHSQTHVFQEMLVMRSLLKPGDYLIVEDSNVNGHPVFPDHGPGPYEAIQQYISQYPDDYKRDREMEERFGFTFAPHGYLIRK